jgi:hypothetical protein
MTLVERQLATFGKRSVQWTGLLERVSRAFLESADVELPESDLKNARTLVEGLVDLVQAGAVTRLELQAGEDGLAVLFPADPDTTDELDVSVLKLCDLAGPRVEICLVVPDVPLAEALGAEALTRLTSEHLVISVRAAQSNADAIREPDQKDPTATEQETDT